MLYSSEDFINYLDNYNLYINIDDRKVDYYSLENALERGNLFKELYLPYKNYSIKEIKVDNERDRMLLNIYQLDFALNDLNLYLDIHPNDEKALKMFEDYNAKLKALKNTYGEKYRPLCLDNVKGKYDWLDNPWTWDNMGGVKYV